MLDDAGVLASGPGCAIGGARRPLTQWPRQVRPRACGRIERGGQRLFDSVQATWNLLEPSVGNALLKQMRRASVIVKEVLANGQLTSRREASCIRIAQRALGVRPSSWARARCARDRGGAGATVGRCVLSGAVTVEQLASISRRGRRYTDGCARAPARSSVPPRILETGAASVGRTNAYVAFVPSDRITTPVTRGRALPMRHHDPAVH